MKLDKRKEEVLYKLVAEYVRIGKPISSEYLAIKLSENLSPATIRNELADLTRFGYLEQPHTSAGRIPTILAYHFYVFMFLKELRTKKIIPEKLDIDWKYSNLMYLLDEIACKISQTTKQVSLILPPESKEDKIRSFSIIPFSSKKAFVIILTDLEETIDFPIEIKEEDTPIFTISNLIFESIKEKKISEVINILTSQNLLPKELAARFSYLVDELKEGLLKTSKHEKFQKIYIKGTQNILSEFDLDKDMLYQLLNFLEREDILIEFLRSLSEKEDITLLIGSDNPYLILKNFSIVSVRYTIDQYRGVLALLGPIRMDYIRNISILEQVSNYLKAHQHSY